LTTILGTGGGTVSFVFSLVVSSISSTEAFLSWIEISPPPSRYELYVNQAYYGSTETTSMTVTDLTPDTQYCFQVLAVSASEGIRDQTNLVCKHTPSSASSTASVVFMAGTNPSEDSAAGDLPVRVPYGYCEGICSDSPGASSDRLKGMEVGIDDGNTPPSRRADTNTPAPGGRVSGLPGWSFSSIETGRHSGASNALSLDTRDGVHIVYSDGTAGAAACLKHATRVFGSWHVSLVDGMEENGVSLSLWQDPAGWSHLSYLDPEGRKLKYATDLSGSWMADTVDRAIDPAVNTSIRTDSSGKVTIAYLDPVSHVLKIATKLYGPWEIQVVDSAGVVGEGTWAAVCLDSADRVHLVYYDGSLDPLRPATGVLKYATDTWGGWETQTVDWGGDVGRFCSIAVDSVDRVHVSYLDSTVHVLKYATNASGSWETQEIDATGGTGGSTAIALDSAGRVHITYLNSTRGAVRYATNASGLWKMYTLEEGASSKGQISMAVEPAGRVHVCYQAGGDFRYATNVAAR